MLHRGSQEVSPRARLLLALEQDVEQVLRLLLKRLQVTLLRRLQMAQGQLQVLPQGQGEVPEERDHLGEGGKEGGQAAQEVHEAWAQNPPCQRGELQLLPGDEWGRGRDPWDTEAPACRIQDQESPWRVEKWAATSGPASAHRNPSALSHRFSLQSIVTSLFRGTVVLFSLDEEHLPPKPPSSASSSFPPPLAGSRAFALQSQTAAIRSNAHRPSGTTCSA